MKKTLFTLMIAVLFACSTFAQAQQKGIPFYVYNTSITGAVYNEFSNEERSTYAMGLIHGMLMAPAFGAMEKDVHWLYKCSEPMTDTQVAAILTKYLKDHPERWHKAAHFSMYEAMKGVCSSSSR